MKKTIAWIMTLGLFATASAVATPLTGMIDSASNYSVIHNGPTPSGSGPADEWRWFDADQQIRVNLEGGLLMLDGEQTFDLTIPAFATTETVTFTMLTMSLDDPNDGFAGGSIVYRTDTIPFGVFGFDDANYNNIFNTSSWDGNQLSVYVWGADPLNEIGIDLALIVTTPEPGVFALFLLGLAGIAVMHRRRFAHAKR